LDFNTFDICAGTLEISRKKSSSFAAKGNLEY